MAQKHTPPEHASDLAPSTNTNTDCQMPPTNCYGRSPRAIGPPSDVFGAFARRAPRAHFGGLYSDSSFTVHSHRTRLPLRRSTKARSFHDMAPLHLCTAPCVVDDPLSPLCPRHSHTLAHSCASSTATLRPTLCLRHRHTTSDPTTALWPYTTRTTRIPRGPRGFHPR